MKSSKKIISAIVALGFITMPCTSFAEGITNEKEEVIYAMTDSYGKVTDVYAVNILGGGSVTDYGDYSDVKILNTTDKINQNGDVITFNSSAEKVYYEGKMGNVEIPWNVSLEYILNGNETSAEDLAGKEGQLEIRISINKNENCSVNFYDDYALQVTLALDTNLCSEIKADTATIANVGRNKQLTYTVLPGKGLNTSVFADVKDFEMESVSINGIKLNLNINIDDKELIDKINELNEAVLSLDDGAEAIKSGADELKSGSNDLKDGADELKDGAQKLDDGINSLHDGITTAQNGLAKLNEKSPELVNGSSDIKTVLIKIQTALNGVTAEADKFSQLADASSEIKSGIDKLSEGAALLYNNLSFSSYKAVLSANGFDIEKLKAGNTQIISQLSEQIESLQKSLSSIKGKTGYEEQAKQLETQIQSLQTIILSMQGNNAAINGAESYLDTMSDNARTLSDGISELKLKYSEFDKAINQMCDGLGSTLINLSALSEGINELVGHYTTLDNGINDYTEGVAALVNGYDKIMSGVSELASGSKELRTGTSELYDGTVKLYNGIDELSDGTKELQEGTSKLYDNTANMDIQIDEKIDEILLSISGNKNSEIVSFVSPRNTDVKSIQFVIKTEAIKMATEDAQALVEEPPLTFWQKLLRLFGLY